MRVSPRSQLAAWYFWPVGADTWADGTVTIIPVLLEKLARQVGYWAPDLDVRCTEPGSHGVSCKMPILGHWIDTRSFSLFTKSIILITQIVCLLVIGPRTDDPRIRKLVFAFCVYFGGLTAMLFFFLPSLAPTIQPYLAVFLYMLSMNSYVIASMCYNSWLPILSKNLYEARPSTGEATVALETDPLLERQVVEIDKAPPGLSANMAKISSIATTIGCCGSIVVCLSLQWLLDHTGVGVPSCLSALGLWWATLGSVPAILLPGPEDCPVVIKPKAGKQQSAYELFRSLKRLPQMSKLLAAHFVACDLLMIIPGALGLYSTTHLDFTVADVLGLTILMGSVALVWTPLQPVIQKSLGTSNLKMLIASVVCAFISPLMGCSSVFSSQLGIKNKWNCYVAAMGFAIAVGPYATYSRALISELTPTGYESSIASIFMLSSRSISFLGSMVLGGILQATGRFDIAWLFFAVSTLVTLPIFASIDMDKGLKEAEEYVEAGAVEST